MLNWHVGYIKLYKAIKPLLTGMHHENEKLVIKKAVAKTYPVWHQTLFCLVVCKQTGYPFPRPCFQCCQTNWFVKISALMIFSLDPK